MRADLRVRTPDEPVKIVMVARFAQQKAQREVLDALAQLPRDGWVMTFVGDGPEWELAIAKAQTLGLDDRVQFAGHRDDVVAVLAGSDIGLLWSHYEGMPLALMEAMRAGLACVANDLPGVRALFGDPPAGVVVPFDSTALAAALEALLADESRRVALAAASRSRFESEYSMSVHLAAIEKVYLASRGPQ
jgi:glycosyltransferase involved in cell wall biosynthesis